MKKLFPVLILVFSSLASCSQKSDIVQDYANLPSYLKEVSGMSYDANSNSFWVLQDSGNKSELYRVDSLGQVVQTLKIKNQKNRDWEELTADTEGNLYIGDFGNNKNTRKDLQIIKINKDQLTASQTKADYVITFEYPEQKEFPPKETELLYDAEAFFYFDDHFYIFTKNRSKAFDGTSLVYKIPNEAGHHQAKYVQTFRGCNVYKHCAITAAAISPDQKTFVLLSHTKLWVIDNFNPNAILDGKIEVHKLHHNTQKEAVTFGDNNTLYISDEVKKNSGGKIYKVDLNQLKPKS
ncbi:SdiA-regulated domain-containing protein [Myroides odoratus]|uniref:SdiA-regulated domain-containing protein n=1 Tax=Myroides odoratus TaxID=256 RepID=UPI0039AF18C4